jgi:hypothetical protein
MYTVVWKSLDGPEMIPHNVYNGLDGLETCFWTAWKGSNVARRSSHATFIMVWMAWRRAVGRLGEAQTLRLQWFGRLGEFSRGSNAMSMYTMVWKKLDGPRAFGGPNVYPPAPAPSPPRPITSQRREGLQGGRIQAHTPIWSWAKINCRIIRLRLKLIRLKLIRLRLRIRLIRLRLRLRFRIQDQAQVNALTPLERRICVAYVIVKTDCVVWVIRWLVYQIFKLIEDDSLAAEFMDMRSCKLDGYTRGLLKSFPTVEQLGSADCKVELKELARHVEIEIQRIENRNARIRRCKVST